MPDGFVEVAFHGGGAEELDLESWGAEEGAQNPGELGSNKEVAGKPGKEGTGAVCRSGGEAADMAEQGTVGDDAGIGDYEGMGE